MERSQRSRLLRRALLANAGFSTLCAITLTAFQTSLAPHLGVNEGWLLALAAGLVAFAGSLVWQATRPTVGRTDAIITCVADGLWVLGSAVLLLGWPAVLTSTGVAMVAAVATGVGLLGVTQAVGIRQLGAGA